MQGKEVPSHEVERNAPVTNDKFAEEEELIAAAQSILRDRLAAINSEPPEHSTVNSRKHARRKLRQKIYLMTSCSDSENSISVASVSKNTADNFGFASDDQRRSRPVHPKEA